MIGGVGISAGIQQRAHTFDAERGGVHQRRIAARVRGLRAGTGTANGRRAPGDRYCKSGQ